MPTAAEPPVVADGHNASGTAVNGYGPDQASVDHPASQMAADLM
jgi:hypothetical protein